MKKTVINIGQGVLSSDTEAGSQFKNVTQAKEEAFNSLKSSNITLKEAGRNIKCYETSHASIFNPKGNPNAIRSIIPDT